MTDEEILRTYVAVAGTEGVFCEPASAASVAGVVRTGTVKVGCARAKRSICRSRVMA